MSTLNTRTTSQWHDILTLCGVGQALAQVHAQAFADTLTGSRLSAGERELDDFLGQILHESGLLTRLRENMNYSADRIRQVAASQSAGSRWRQAAIIAEDLVRAGPPAIANFLYANRMGNGPAASGDGWDFRGGAHLMATGRRMYEHLGELIGQDLTVNPTLVEMPHYGLEISVACWEELVPDICLDDCTKVTKRVNGGEIGIAHRIELTQAARKALDLCK